MTLTLTDEMREALKGGPVEILDERTGVVYDLTPRPKPAAAGLSPEDIAVLRDALQPAIDEADAGLARPWKPGDMERIGRRMRAERDEAGRS